MRIQTGDVAVVTGAASGMGRALAVGLARRGCRVAICDVNSEGLDGTRAAMPAGAASSVHLVDVADLAAMTHFAEAVVDTHGQVNLVFNNAGVSVTDTAEQMQLEDFEWLMGINFWGVVYGCRVFLPLMKSVDRAHIVNTSSIFGMAAFPTQSAYNASKFAVRGYTESLRQELKDSHIGVSCVMPGGVKTNIVRDSRFTLRDNEAPTREEFVGQFETLAALTSEQAADIILRGVERDRARILVGRDAKALDLIARFAPASYPRILERLTGLFGRDSLF